MTNQDLDSHLKKSIRITTSIAALCGILTSLFIVYGFYYKTNETLTTHSETIKEVKIDVVAIKEKLSTTDVFQGVSKVEMESLQDKVISMEKKVDKIDDKLDKILIQTK